MKSTILLLYVFEEDYKTLFKIVYSIAGNVEDTMAILQGAFLTAYTRYNSHKSKEDTLKLLIEISKNTAATYKKRSRTFEQADSGDKIGATDIPSLELFLRKLKTLGPAVPIDMFNYLMMNILGGVPLLEISRKSKIPYDQLIYWKTIILKELSDWIKSSPLT